MKKIGLTGQITFALVLGIVVGHVCNTQISDAATLKDTAGYLGMFSDIFLRMIKMIIAPLVFATLVSGLAGMNDAKTVGRIGSRAVGWFIVASLVSLSLGLLFANLLQPGTGLNVKLPDVGQATTLSTKALNLKDFIVQVFPKSIVESMASNSVLQILVFSVFFGLALGHMNKNAAQQSLVHSIEELVHVMLKVTEFVMRFAPLGVFGAVSSVIANQGIGVLGVYGKFIAAFYLTLTALWALLFLAGWAVLGKDIFRLTSLMRDPMLVAFSTASSESVYPRMMEQLTRFGVPRKISSFVLPLGYSFNLDGSMVYASFAAIFIAQAYGIPMPLTTQIAMLLVLMVSSKGIAGVPRASLVVVAAVVPMFGLPDAGILLILGIDHFLDMGRTATNVLGNAIATAVVSKWETTPLAKAARSSGRPVNSNHPTRRPQPTVTATRTSAARAE